MSVCLLLKDVSRDTAGAETCIRVIGDRNPPARMSVQVAVTGAAKVQIQGRIAREAPWLDLGPAHSSSALLNIEPVQFLRAVTSGMEAASTVSVWAVWGW